MKTDTKYCKKHNFEYYDYLHDCPICVGETMKPHERLGETIPIKKQTHETKTKFKRKLTGFKL